LNSIARVYTGLRRTIAVDARGLQIAANTTPTYRET